MIPTKKHHDSPTMAQRRRVDEAEALVGKEVFLTGTEHTTKVKGIIDSVQIISPKTKGDNLKFRYTVLWEGQKQPFYTHRSGFQT
tara:strand:+ start:3613 stop:3867 length:255 start_codon:yes stop_codon:yes gene_type:complete